MGKYASCMAALDVVERTDQCRYCYGRGCVGGYVFNSFLRIWDER